MVAPQREPGQDNTFDSSSPSGTSPEELLNLPLFSKMVKSPQKARILLDFCKYFEEFNLQLGNSIYRLSAVELIKNEPSSQYLYVVCQGRVRLLGFDKNKRREVPIQLISEGDTFGGDFLWDETYLPYHAVAASPVRVARIEIEKWQLMQGLLPEVRQTWQKAARDRQCLLFFKTKTSLRSLPSSQLRQLLPYIHSKQVSAGESLKIATPPEEGRFWLSDGRVEDLVTGSCWGYPEETPNLVAQSDLWLYWLPLKNWEEAITIADLVETPSREKLRSQPIIENLERAFESEKSPLKEEVTVEFPQPHQRDFLPRWGGYPFIAQQSSSDCGAACLAMISQYWGKRFSLNYLRQIAGVGRRGTSLKSLAKAAESLGYLASPVRANLAPLAERENPWIAHWKRDHYIVVYEIKGDRVTIADPATGKHVLSRQEFLTDWTGYSLLLEPTPQLMAAQNQKPSLGKYASLLWYWRSLGLQIILASILVQAFGLVTPLFTQVILDRVVVNKSMTTLHVFALGALLFGIGSVALASVREYLLSYLSNRLNLTAIASFINHALSLPLKFFESRQVGDIITRVQENHKIQRFLISQVLIAWLNLVTGFIYLGLMLYYNWRLTLLILGLIPPIVILTLAATPLLRKISREGFQAATEQQSSLVEMISGVATIKATAAEQDLRWRWEERLSEQLNVQFKGQKLGIDLNVVSGSIDTVGSTLLLWYGASLVIQDQLTIGQFVAFNMMKGYLIGPIIALAKLWDELQEVLISVERLDDVYDTTPEEVPGKAKLALPSLWGDIRFENVSFSYDSEQERNTLGNISFEVKAGQTIAIVGRSGSGKSTLVKLLQGFYYPNSGTIWIDGHDIRQVSLHSLRSQLGVVPQECFLFTGTILENITLFRPEYTLEQAVEVAKLAEAHGFIQSLPLGYNTPVGERGINLSGGQRQRIALARALLGDPRILILDEATSSLDTESERRFQQNLQRMTRERTTFIIAHRLSTVRNADCILVIDRGVLVEKGNHSELLARKGLYYHLATQQIDL